MGFESYRAAFDNPPFWRVTWNSLEMFLVTAVCAMIIGIVLLIPAAVAFVIKRAVAGSIMQLADAGPGSCRRCLLRTYA